MSESNVRLQLLGLAVQAGTPVEDLITVASSLEEWVTEAATPAPAPAPKAAVKDKAPAAAKAPAAKAPATAGKAVEPEAPAAAVIDTKQVTEAVIALVNAGNAAAGDEKTGRQYAAAVLQPFGAKNVSTVKVEDYAKVIEALQAKLADVQAAATSDDLTS